MELTFLVLAIFQLLFDVSLVVYIYKNTVGKVDINTYNNTVKRIKNTLNEIMYATKADAVRLWEFQNGTISISKMHDVRILLNYECVQDYDYSIIEKYKPETATLYSSLISELKDKPYFYFSPIDNDDIEYRTLSNKLLSRHIYKCLFIRVQHYDSNFSIMSIEYGKGKNISLQAPMFYESMYDNIKEIEILMNKS